MSEELSEVTLRRILRWVIGFIVLLLFLAASGSITLLEVPFRLFLGWFFHAIELAGHVRPAWTTIGLSIACLLVVAALGHRLASWLRLDRRWQPSHTVVSLVLLLLGAAAAISLSGVVHQLAWLGSSPMFTDRSTSDTSRALSAGREIALSLTDYAADHGQYPDNLEDLVKGNYLSAETLHGRSRTLQDTFVLLLPGQEPRLEQPRPLLVRTVQQGLSDGIIVVDESCASRTLPISSFDAIVQQARAHEP